MDWKKFGLHLSLLLLTAVASSLMTWYALTRQHRDVSWKQVLDLTPEQAEKFSAMESEFNLALKQIAVEDAQNKLSLCSYLHAETMDRGEIDAAARRMAGLYEQKQKTLAAKLAAISALLTHEQRKIFSSRLMHEICASCRKATATDRCLCGMCASHA